MKLFALLLCISFFIQPSINAREPDNKGIIILGSSHSYYMDWDGLHGFKRNSSVPEFTSQQLAWTLIHSVIVYKPEYCVLQTGPEDLMLGISPERIIENIEKIHLELIEDSISLIVLSGIQNPSKKALGAVNVLNKEIETWAIENEVLYVDISDLVYSSSSFDENFFILPEYQKKIINRLNKAIFENHQINTTNSLL